MLYPGLPREPTSKPTGKIEGILGYETGSFPRGSNIILHVVGLVISCAVAFPAELQAG